MRIVNTKEYREDGIREFNFAVHSYKEATEKVMTNHYLVSTIHKLFQNVKASSIFSMETDNNLIKNNVVNLNYDNQDINKTITLDIKSLHDNQDLSQKINVIAKVPDVLAKSFLSLELSLIQKMKKENPSVVLSDYSNRLIKLFNGLYNKDLTEINIDNNVVENFIEEKDKQFKDLSNINSKISSITKELSAKNLAMNELQKTIGIEIQKVNVHDNNIKGQRIEIESLEKEKQKILHESLNFFDKLKVKVFELIGINGVYEEIIKEKEKNNYLINNLKYKNQSLKIESDYEETKKNAVVERIQIFRKNLENTKNIKTSLENTLMHLEEEKQKIRENLISSTNIADISVFQNKTLGVIAQKQVFAIHVFPLYYPEENSPLKESLNPTDKINAIRAFNPSLSTSTYVLNGEGFDNETFGKGVRGVILGSGNITQITIGDAGTIVDDNGNRTGFGYQDLQKDIEFLSERSNRVTSYNEVVVADSIPYAEIIQIDQYVKSKAEDMREEKKDFQLNTSEWFKYIDNVITEGKINSKKYNIEPLPLLIMINGKLLEVTKTNPLNEKNIPIKSNIKDLEIHLKEQFYVKEIKDINEITKTSDLLEKDTREVLAKELIGKYKNNIANFIEKDLELKHNIKLKNS